MSETPQNCETTVEADAQNGCPLCKKRRLPLIVLVVVIIIVVVALIAGKDIIKLRFSEPYNMATEAVLADAKVLEKLGEPLKIAGLPSGELDGDECRLFFRVVGPNGEGTVSALARSRNDVWAFNQLEVAFADGSKTSVETAAQEGGLEEAPAWNPQ